MRADTLRVILVDPKAASVDAVHETLAADRPGQVRLTHVRHAAQAMDHLASEPAEIALVRLVSAARPDASGLDEDIDTIRHIHKVAPDLPIIVLHDVNDADAEVRSLQEGVQDFLTTDDVARGRLGRAIRHAIERQKTQAALQSLALVDDLTGLYNRRGFLTLASHQVKLARRHEKAFALVFVDLDGLKTINDTLGHLDGDQAIAEMTAILRDCFRASDIVSRLGGDEFCALLVDATERGAALVQARMRARLEAKNAEPGRRFRLAFSIGILCCDPGDARPLDELIAEVDARMYLEKSRRRRASATRTHPSAEPSVV